MGGDAIARLLEGRYEDRDGGPPLAVPTRSVVIEESLAGHEADLVKALDLGDRLTVVSDATTHAVLGERVADALESIATVERLVLPSDPHADGDTAARIGTETASSDALIAVGSGTINDLCKYTGAEVGKPYAVFATAPSMNGYGSVSASIMVNGHKKSLPAQAAAGIFIDLSVFAAAPPRMIRSGLGDSLCRPTAQADWLLAHLLRDEPYRQAPFELLAEDEDALFGEPQALLQGDLEAMRRLARTLVLSGFGMTISEGSYPASQGEHLIGHYVEMMGDPAGPVSYHGEQIGVTTLTMARLQKRLLDGPAPVLQAGGPTETELRAHFGDALGASCWREFAKKRPTPVDIERLNARLAERWPEMARRIGAISRAPSMLEEVLAKAQAPRRPADLSWSESFYREAVSHAREIRDRYTFLDLAADARLLDGEATAA
jgi:glycerol-1-phosphate dehydrogenase [NAD(P)+]